MSCYENLIMKTQMNYSRHYSTYASGGTAVVLSKQKPLSYEEQIQEFVRRVQEAECIVVGGASGLSAAGGGDFYYSDTPSFREHFGKFADKYGYESLEKVKRDFPEEDLITQIVTEKVNDYLVSVTKVMIK